MGTVPIRLETCCDAAESNAAWPAVHGTRVLPLWALLFVTARNGSRHELYDTASLSTLVHRHEQRWLCVMVVRHISVRVSDCSGRAYLQCDGLDVHQRKLCL